MTDKPDKVIVNGRTTDLPHQVCTRCVQDTTVPGISFDEEGVCNFCHLHELMCRMYPSGEEGQKRLEKIFNKIKKAGRGKKYDCVVGISGGRDSTWLLYSVVKRWGLRPIAVHFNDGFDNPVGGENMVNACNALGVELRTITSDWREGRDLKIDFLKASVPDLNLGTDIGIASSTFGVAAKEGLKYILIGQSFRTEGVKPRSWSFFDGDYLRNVHKVFGTYPLGKWKPEAPGFNFGARELAYYTAIKGIHVFTPFYYEDYNRAEAEKHIKKLGWVYPGAHYFDDLYHALIKYVHRVKFNIDLNMNSDAALVRTGQMPREEGLKRAHSVYKIEDPDVIRLCIKRLGLTQEEFDQIMKLPPKTFYDYPTSWPLYRAMRWPIFLLSRLNLVPKVTYEKYFKCGE